MCQYLKFTSTLGLYGMNNENLRNYMLSENFEIFRKKLFTFATMNLEEVHILS